MEHAIDKETIVDEVLFGITRVTNTGLSWIVAPYGGDYNSVDQGYTGDFPIEFREYNPDKARQILDDAGGNSMQKVSARKVTSPSIMSKPRTTTMLPLGLKRSLVTGKKSASSSSPFPSNRVSSSKH
jgi:ABC-type transport system substrate-binding protein